MSGPTLGVSHVLLGVCGSAGAAHAPALAGALSTLGGVEVKSVLTRAALEFTTARALQLNTRHRAYCDEDAFDGVAHLELTRWADLVLVMPATANSLAVAASGAAPDLLSTCIVAATSPVVFVPSMNEVMWGKAAVQRNVATLRTDGHGVIPPGCGPAAVDGKVGRGALPPMPEILAWLGSWLADRTGWGHEPVPTSGRPAIAQDSVRAGASHAS